MTLKARASFILSSILITACSGGEPPAGDKSFKGTDNAISPQLGSDGLESWAKSVYAQASWQDFGISVSAGQKIYIKAEGTWSGGQVVIGDNEESTEILNCDANGCNGEELVAFADSHIPALTVVPGAPNRCGREAGYTQLYPYHPDNIREHPSSMTEMVGFADGELDGSVACFSFNGTFLGGNVSNLSNGYWAVRRRAWKATLDHWINDCGYDADRPDIIGFGTGMYELYRDATCENPVTEAQVTQIIATARDTAPGYLWRGIETVYEPVYYADVPEGNYKERCSNEGSTIINYRYGKVSHRIPKNHCYNGILNSLIMKIVPKGKSFDDVEPVLVGKDYESNTFKVPADGRVFFRNNDVDHGIGDNSGFLNVSVELAPSTSQ